MIKYLYKIPLLIFCLSLGSIAICQDIPTSGKISGTYNLTKNITLNGTLTVEAGKEAIINLNGYTINRNGSKSADFVFLVSGTLHLNGNGIIKGGRGDRGGCALISGTLIVNGPTIQDCIAYDGEYGEAPTVEKPDINYYTQGCGGAFFVNQGAKLYSKLQDRKI